MKTVLLVNGASDATLHDALVQRSFTVVTCTPDDAASRVRESHPELVVVEGLSDASPKFVAHLRQTVTGCPGVLVALTQRNDPVRDQCLTIGAADVAVDGDPSDVASRASALVNGWERSPARKPFKASIRTQRARQTLSLVASEIEPTGFSFSGTPEVNHGDLVRSALPLPQGQIIVWGRVLEVDGSRTVRFLALSSEERSRLALLITGLSEVTNPGISRPSFPAIPVMTRSVASMPPAPARSIPPSTSTSIVDEVTRPPTNAPPLTIVTALAPAPPSESSAAASLPQREATLRPWTEATLRPVGSADVTRPPVSPATMPPAAPATMPPAAHATVPPVSPATMPPAAPVTVPPGSPATVPPKAVDPAGIDDLIGSALNEGMEGTTPEGAAPAGPPWPTVRYTDEAAAAAFREGATSGLVATTDGAPTGEAVLAFVRTLSIPEQHAFDKEPPASLPEPGLAARALTLRLRLFAYIQDAATVAATGVRPEIDTAFVAAIEAEVKAADAELQKATGGYLTSGDQARLKDVTQFKNTLVRAQKDFRGALSRLKGEAALEDGPALLLDSEARPSSGTSGFVRREVSQERPVEKKAEYPRPFGLDAPVKRRERGRIVLWTTALVALTGLFLVLRHKGFQPLTEADVVAVGASTIIVDDDLHKAKITVPMGWKLDPHNEQLDKLMTEHKVEEWAVITEKGQLVAFRKQGRGLVKTRAATTGGVPQKPPGANAGK